MVKRKVKRWLLWGAVTGMAHFVFVTGLFASGYIYRLIVGPGNTEVYSAVIGMILIVVDYPLSVLAGPILKTMQNNLLLWFIYFVLGSLWWVFIGVVAGFIFSKLRRRTKNE
jgi:hypothetical protein